jgi:hypothetical protein
MQTLPYCLPELSSNCIFSIQAASKERVYEAQEPHKNQIWRSFTTALRHISALGLLQYRKYHASGSGRLGAKEKVSFEMASVPGQPLIKEGLFMKGQQKLLKRLSLTSWILTGKDVYVQWLMSKGLRLICGIVRSVPRLGYV